MLTPISNTKRLTNSCLGCLEAEFSNLKLSHGSVVIAYCDLNNMDNSSWSDQLARVMTCCNLGFINKSEP